MTRAHAQSLLDRIHDVVFHCDPQGRITYVNAAWKRLTGGTPDEAVGRELAEFVHPDDRHVHLERFRALLEGRRATLQLEVRTAQEDGLERWVDVAMHAETDESNAITGVTGTVSDVTTRRQIQEELRQLAREAEEARADAESAAHLLRVEAEELGRERDHAVSAARSSAEFIASMAHDLRTPLNGVLGMLELLLHTALTADQRDQALTARGSAESLVRLVGDIVDFARAGSGQLAVESADFGLREVVEDVTRLLSQKSLAKGIAFYATVAPTVPERVFGDAAHVRQVIMNLASNAVRCTDDGSVSLVVSHGARGAGDGRVPVRLEIHDTDASLSASLMANQLLGDGENAPGAVHGSAGLGLAISRRLTEAMGGTIQVGSEPGRGSWISVELPFERARTAAAPTRDQGLSLSAAPLHLRVLVAEDNPVNQKVVTRLLARWGVQADVVGDGAAAVDAASKTAYDLVLMDVRMPVLDGLQATEQLRAAEAGSGRHTPIVAMTANVLSGDRIACTQAGMDGFVGKPIQASELYAEIARWNEHREEGRAAA